MMFTRLMPFAGLPPLLRLLWPLIWLQIMALKLQVRARYGRGVPFAFIIWPSGRVVLTRIAAEYHQSLIPAHLIPSPAPAVRPVSRKLRELAALLCEPPNPAPVPAAITGVPSSQTMGMARPHPDTS